MVRQDDRMVDDDGMVASQVSLTVRNCRQRFEMTFSSKKNQRGSRDSASYLFLLYVLILGERAAENEVLLCGFPYCDRCVIAQDLRRSPSFCVMQLTPLVLEIENYFLLIIRQ
jgi:hypothetical protein